MFSAIIAGICALGGAIISSAVSSSSADKALKAQEKWAKEANLQSQENWREEMRVAEEQRKKDNLARSMQMFQSALNKNAEYKQQVASLWAGR